MRVEVVYALALAQEVRAVDLPEGATALEAVAASGLLARLSDKPPQLGLFGKRIRADRPLKEGDRVEILRPLAADPKEARRRRARQAAKRPRG